MKAEKKLANATAEVTMWEEQLKASYSPYKYRMLEKAKEKLRKVKILIEGVQTKMI